MGRREDLHERTFRTLAAGMALVQIAASLWVAQDRRVGGWAEADFYGVYAPQALRLLAGEPYTHSLSGPGYSALLAMCSWLTDDLYAAAKVIAAVSVAGFAWLSSLTAQRVAGAAAALSMQLALHVTLFRNSFFAGNDQPCALLVAAALFFLVRRASPSPTDLFASGAAIALATATRFPAACLVAVAVTTLLLAHPSRAPRRQRYRDCLWLFGGVAVTAAPWLIANLRWSGTLLHSQAHGLVALQAFGDPAQQLSPRHVYAMGERFTSPWAVLTHDPPTLLRELALAFHADAVQVLADLVTFPALLFVGVGLVWIAAGRGVDRRRSVPLLLFAVSWFGSVALAPYQARYYHPIAPMLLGAAALGLLRPWAGAVDETRLARDLRWAAGALSLSVLVLGSAVKTREWLRNEPVELFEAASVLARNAGRGDLVLARKPHLAWLADVRIAWLPPPEDVATLLRQARRDGVRFFYVGPQEVATNAQLEPLAHGDAPSGLSLLHRHRAPDACLYRID